MDSYIQILCRFQKWKRKVPPPSLLSTQKSPFYALTLKRKNSALTQDDFRSEKSDGLLYKLKLTFVLLFQVNRYWNRLSKWYRIHFTRF